MSRTRAMLAAGVAVALSIGGSSAASAGLLRISISDGTDSLTVVDGDANDVDAAPNSINVRPEALALIIPPGVPPEVSGLDSGSTLSAVTNQGTTDIFGNLQIIARLKRLAASASDIVYTIVASQTGFLVPAGPNKVTTSSATATFTSAPTTNSVTYTSGADPANGADPNGFGFIVVSPGTSSMSSISSTQENAHSRNEGPAFFSDTGTYSLTGRIVVNTSPNAQVQTSGSVRVDANPEGGPLVPEPGTLALMALGGVGLVGGAVRRRKA